jgi:anti-sigma B factor antagonist
MPETFAITVTSESDSTPVLKLRGRLDAAGAQLLRERCTELRERGHTRSVLDLDAVSFVASSGLGTFLLLTDEFRSAGGKLILAAPRRGVIQVFELLNVDRFLDIALTLDSALAETRT